jgi:hypothetical protein
MTPFGKALRNASKSGENRSTPNFGGLNTIVLPMMRAGISVAKVSFSG